MAVTLMELIASWTQLGVYSHFTQPGERLQRFMGMNIGGPRESRQRGRLFSFNYFDHTRDVAVFRNPGTGPSVVSATPLGRCSGTFGRTHEKKVLPYEVLGNLRPIEQNGELDPGGQRYVARQQKTLYQRFSNAREIAVAGMLRGSLGFIFQGEDLVPVFTGGDFTIDFNVPSTNKGKLKKSDDATDIIDASWSNAGTKILDHLVEIEQASEYRTGRPIRHVWTDSKVWNFVINNTQVKDTAGSAAAPFQAWDMVEETGPDGKPIRYFNAVLRGYPHIQWHIYNSGLNVNGTYTRFFDGTTASFLPDPEEDWVEMGVGSEYVVETPGAEPTEATGFFPWGKTSDEPASLQLLAVDNFMPFLYVPKCVHWGEVVF
jgi:hypothetical protein